jgi:trehalose 6-phosphate phosphatase
MKYVFARANRDVLRQFAGARTLLAFDFDGTLAPIVSDPEQAAMRPTTRELLAALARQYPCVVISGRSRADTARRMRGVRAVEIVGNHGMEPRQPARPALLAVRRWRRALARQLASFSGVTVEDKGYSLAVHYRRSREKSKARVAILQAVAGLRGVRLIRGKQVVDLVPIEAPHKGIALERARARLGCEAAIYVGDDETDEDAFGMGQPGRLLTIRVGERRRSAAAYFLRNQAEIDRLLEALLRDAPVSWRSRAINRRDEIGAGRSGTGLTKRPRTPE